MAPSSQDPADMAERNRELIAQRLGHPAETVEECRRIERECPGYFAWYDDGKLPGHQERYAARKVRAMFGDPDHYGATADDVIAAVRQARSAGGEP